MVFWCFLWFVFLVFSVECRRLGCVDGSYCSFVGEVLFLYYDYLDWELFWGYEGLLGMLRFVRLIVWLGVNWGVVRICRW